jgi:hypothetical protein
MSIGDKRVNSSGSDIRNTEEESITGRKGQENIKRWPQEK